MTHELKQALSELLVQIERVAVDCVDVDLMYRAKDLREKLWRL
jgi:hypothetical protein